VAPSDTPLSSGEPADAETVAAITATMGQLAACSNAGDRLGGLGAVSDGFIHALYQALFGNGGVTRAELEALLAPPATPATDGDRIEAFAITDVVVLADGRVAGVVVTSDPDEEPLLIYFVELEGRWLIDEVPEP
jgi:hypothetical protein